jgi:hypothetical protein
MLDFLKAALTHALAVYSARAPSDHAVAPAITELISRRLIASQTRSLPTPINFR